MDDSPGDQDGGLRDSSEPGIAVSRGGWGRRASLQRVNSVSNFTTLRPTDIILYLFLSLRLQFAPSKSQFSREKEQNNKTNGPASKHQTRDLEGKVTNK
jgi:hypothetical protein